MDYQIVPITMDHLDGFRAAVDSVARERKYLSVVEGFPYQMTLDYIQGNIAANWPHIVAIYNRQVIGWCDITPAGFALPQSIFNHCASLGMGVISGFRGQGIGQALLKTALQMAKEKGLLRIELTVIASNQPAIHLYQKLGFMVEGTLRNRVLIDGKFDDLIYMGLLF